MLFQKQQSNSARLRKNAVISLQSHHPTMTCSLMCTVLNWTVKYKLYVVSSNAIGENFCDYTQHWFTQLETRKAVNIKYKTDHLLLNSPFKLRMRYASENQPGPPEYYKPCLSAYVYNTIIIKYTCTIVLFWSPIEAPKSSEMQGQTLSAFGRTNLTHIKL